MRVLDTFDVSTRMRYALDAAKHPESHDRHQELPKGQHKHNLCFSCPSCKPFVRVMDTSHSSLVLESVPHFVTGEGSYERNQV